MKSPQRPRVKRKRIRPKLWKWSLDCCVCDSTYRGSCAPKKWNCEIRNADQTRATPTPHFHVAHNDTESVSDVSLPETKHSARNGGWIVVSSRQKPTFGCRNTWEVVCRGMKSFGSFHEPHSLHILYTLYNTPIYASGPCCIVYVEGLVGVECIAYEKSSRGGEICRTHATHGTRWLAVTSKTISAKWRSGDDGEKKTMKDNKT